MTDLATLGREYLLAGHLIDRAGMPHVLRGHGLEGMKAIAIEEWMAASPVYTRRTQKTLGFHGDDVATIFKGMQLDIGAPHEFMDFRYRVHDAHRGEFWLAHCGALMDVEPMGDDFVVGMCHHIEDPTFDATACATNPRARMRPRHRPPRVPAERHAHCHWDVVIDEAAEALPEPEGAARLAQCRAANAPITVHQDYAGAFDPDFHLESLSPAALDAALDEVCLQGHLLARSFMTAVARRDGVDDAVAIGHRQLTGIAGVAARRLVRLDLDDDGGALARIAAVLDVHPAFRPRSYVDWHVEAETARVTAWLGDCDGLREGDDMAWPALLGAHDDAHPALSAIAHAVDPRARVEQVAAPAGAVRAWAFTVDPDAAPAREATEVTLTRVSTGADFEFRGR
ncbi:MAG: hypothetical protein H0W70_09020 [Actinobacteria bacterium]|nr:hypothetical protein [Actinomycetota bacterium]